MPGDDNAGSILAQHRKCTYRAIPCTSITSLKYLPCTSTPEHDFISTVALGVVHEPVQMLRQGTPLHGFREGMQHRFWEAQPRKSWQMRKKREKAALKAGLAEWQANPYYCAGRVTVPAILDTFACQCFFNRCAPCSCHAAPGV